MNGEKLKEMVEIFTIEDLIEVIKSQPIINGKNDYKKYSKKDKEKLRQILIEITKLCIDLTSKEEEILTKDLEQRLGKNGTELIKSILKSL